MFYSSEYVTFYNGHKMPIIGLGTWQSLADEDVSATLDAALEAGYRHIDTALTYRNEAQIGKALKKWLTSGKLKREDLFIVTKLPPCGNRAESVEKYLKKSLDALQLDYIDLYLIHQPYGVQESVNNLFPTGDDGNILIDTKTDLVSLWKGMEAQVDAGRTRSIGISNFNSQQIKRIWKTAYIKPANLQIELHVYCQQRELVAFCNALDISVSAYAPICSPHMYSAVRRRGGDVNMVPQQSALTDITVQSIAEKYGKTSAQVLLRHTIQRGIAVIPKSSNPNRIRENFQVFDFELSQEDVDLLNSLDKGSKGRQFNSELLPGTAAHPEFPYTIPY